MAITESRQEALKEKATLNDPRLKRLEKVDRLASPPARTMTEMTGGESVYFAVLEALHNSGIVHLPASVTFLELLRENRVSLNRKARKEFLQGLVGVSATRSEDPGSLGSGGSLQEPQKKRRWMFWKRDEE